MKTRYYTYHIDSAVDESVSEALLMAEFFREVRQGQSGEVRKPDGASAVQLEIARVYLQQPIGIDVFAPTVENNRRPKR